MLQGLAEHCIHTPPPRMRIPRHHRENPKKKKKKNIILITGKLRIMKVYRILWIITFLGSGIPIINLHLPQLHPGWGVRSKKHPKKFSAFPVEMTIHHHFDISWPLVAKTHQYCGQLSHLKFAQEEKSDHTAVGIKSGEVVKTVGRNVKYPLNINHCSHLAYSSSTFSR